MLSFFRRAVPAGWSFVTDDTCRSLDHGGPPAPQMTGVGAPVLTRPDPATYVLLDQARSVTMLASSPDGGVPDLDEGVTVRLESVGDDLTVVLDHPGFACGTASSEDTVSTSGDAASSERAPR